MLHAIVFDFDGVLADSEPLHYEAFRIVLAAHGVALTRADYDARYLGYDDAGAFRAVLADAGRPPDDAALAALVGEKLEVFARLVGGRHVLFPAAEACVRRLGAHVPLAIASGALSQDIDLILAGSGLREAFQVIVGAEQTPRSKPHPDPYALAVRLLQARGAVPAAASAAAGCVAIEDSRWGLESARAAGLACVAVTTSYDAADLAAADLVVNSLDDVSIERLERLVARG
jgi:beta-phosphoglucomutase-like phosphatase (HAD superfamily)